MESRSQTTENGGAPHRLTLSLIFEGLFSMIQITYGSNASELSEADKNNVNWGSTPLVISDQMTA